ncbi:MAG TPA: hypothetical protein VMZ25_10995 [Terriglobales bacterium]|nr:hypothetical protein [Terriglobales bacterium]
MLDDSQFRKKVPERFLQEYLEVLASAQNYQVATLRNWDLLRSYAELQYKLNGGGRCGLCRSHVRHVIPARVEQGDGSAREFTCLCTRCFEGERATAERIIMQMGEARVEYRPRDYGKKVPLKELQPKKGAFRAKV